MPTLRYRTVKPLLLLKQRDNDGASTSTTATITVEAPNVLPSVSISGGDRTIADTDSSAGETVSFTATATDSDGTIASTQWLVGGSEVATGTSASISLGNGMTVVTFKSTDNDGASSTTTVSITILEPGANAHPSISISGGDRTIADTDGSAGETVSFTATATDSDGTIASTQWLLEGWKSQPVPVPTLRYRTVKPLLLLKQRIMMVHQHQPLPPSLLKRLMFAIGKYLWW